MTKVGCFRPYDQQIAILEQITIDDDENDDDFNQIKGIIDILLSNNNNEVQPQKIASKPIQVEEDNNTEQSSKNILETELAKELEKYKVQADFLRAKVNDKKNQIAQTKLENKKREAAFISSLRSIRNHLCKKAESLKSNS